MALMFVLDGQDVIHPLHLLSILELKKVRNKKKNNLCGGMEMDVVVWQMILVNVSVMT
jgi:hypothetical protein